MRVNVAATYNSLGQKYLAYRELLRSERYVRALLGRLTKPGMVLDVGCGAGVPVDNLVVLYRCVRTAFRPPPAA